MYEAGLPVNIQVAREMKNYKIGELGLSETRWLHREQPRLSSGEQLLYLGHTEDGAPLTQREWPGYGHKQHRKYYLSVETCQLPPHHSQVHHQEEKHQAQHLNSATLPPMMQKKRKITSPSNSRQ